MLGSIDTQPPVEISLTTVLAYGAFIIAEHSLGVSGIMAVVAAGLVMGSYGRSKVSPEPNTTCTSSGTMPHGLPMR